MTDLALRFIGPNDFLVVEDSHPIGRTKRASELRGEVWYWNVTIPVPGVPGGSSASLEDAKVAFRQAWTKSKADIGPERLAPPCNCGSCQRAAEGEGEMKQKHHYMMDCYFIRTRRSPMESAASPP